VYPNLKFSFASDFFRDLEKKLPTIEVPTWDGELYFQYLAVCLPPRPRPSGESGKPRKTC